MAKVGRSKVGTLILPTSMFLATGAYYSVHTIFHKQVRDLLAAQKPDGRRQEISESLKDLIKSVYLEVHDKINEAPLESLNIKHGEPVLKWFASSTLDPISFGSLENRTGFLVGLPAHYNYTCAEDFPDDLFEVKKVNLFKSPKDPIKAEELKVQIDYQYGPSEMTAVMKKIDRNSEEGAEFIDSMLLSDDAKKFSIAREIFLGDSPRQLLVTFLIPFSFITTLLMARGSVHILKLKDSHISYRLPGYGISTVAGYSLFRALVSYFNQTFAKKADDRAIELGEAYKRGAEEYFLKAARRLRVLDLSQSQ